MFSRAVRKRVSLFHDQKKKKVTYLKIYFTLLKTFTLRYMKKQTLNLLTNKKWSWGVMTRVTQKGCGTLLSLWFFWKNINGFSTCLSKLSKSIHYNDNHIRNNNDKNNKERMKAVVVIIMTISMTVTVII